MAAKALRNIEKLGGKSYKAGDAVPDAVIASMSPQVLRSLVENHTLEVSGMEAKGAATGSQAHLAARLDRQADQITALTARLDALEGKKPAKVTKPKGSAAAVTKE